jgi:hypothetical protein
MDVYQRRRLVALSAIAVVFIIFVLLIRSCGGDDETTPVTPVAGATGLGGATVLAQSDYVSQGDAICLETNTLLASVDETDAAQAATDQAEIVTSELQQLQSLPPPDDGTDKLDNFLGALEAQAAAYQDKATALDHGDDTAAAEIDTTIDEAATEAADAADNFGFKNCGDPSKVGESDTTGGDSASTTDTGGTETPTDPVVPAETTTPPVTEAPTDTGAATPDAPVTPPADTGGTDSSSGGVSP